MCIIFFPSLSGSSFAGRVIGFSAAAATLLQFTVQNFLYADTVFTVSILLCLCALILTAVLLRRTLPRTSPAPQGNKPQARRGEAAVLIAAVFIMSLVIGLNDGIITALHAQGQMDIASYPRLFYALGLVFAGFIADYKKRRYMPLATVCTMLFSTVAVFFLSNPAMYELNSMLMYFYSGFYMLYFTVSFIDLAPGTGAPELWAGMGRVLRGFATACIALPSVRMFSAWGDMPILLLSCTFSAAVLILLSLSGHLVITRYPEPPQSTVCTERFRISDEERLKAFSEKYALTPRESEVVAHITSGGQNLQKTAEEMYLSRRTLQRYLTSVYIKTGTKSRVMLVRLYLGSTDENSL